MSRQQQNAHKFLRVAREKESNAKIKQKRMDFVVFIYLKQLMYSKKKINDYIYIKFMSRRNDHEQLIENVKSWIGLDEELKTLRKNARALREQKKI